MDNIEIEEANTLLIYWGKKVIRLLGSVAKESEVIEAKKRKEFWRDNLYGKEQGIW